jgi:hypothetical protein
LILLSVRSSDSSEFGVEILGATTILPQLWMIKSPNISKTSNYVLCPFTPLFLFIIKFMISPPSKGEVETAVALASFPIEACAN